MTAKLSIHNVKTIEVEKSQSNSSKDSHYTDFIITCTDGSQVRFELFSKSKLKVKEIKK
jgi:hypothetical protein|tara:strand:+ start:606 stop:782 length:177 start_codon:yes stop_codon:yes gene_type:complete